MSTRVPLATKADLDAALSDPWLPSGVIAETVPRALVVNQTTTLTSGTLRLAGGIVIPAGVTCSAITVFSGTTALATGSNQWFCLVKQSDLSIVAVTADDTSNAWAASTPKTLELAGAWTPDVDSPVYVGVVVVASTMPTVCGEASTTNIHPTADLAPVLGGSSSTSQTSPLAVGKFVSTPTTGSARFYSQVS